MAQDLPPLRTAITGSGPAPMGAWAKWFSDLWNALYGPQPMIQAVRSGTTAARPADGVIVGSMYLDTTLNKPVWVKSLGPIVWIDATGAVV